MCLPLPVSALAGVTAGTSASAVVHIASVKSRIANWLMRPSRGGAGLAEAYRWYTAPEKTFPWPSHQLAIICRLCSGPPRPPAVDWRHVHFARERTFRYLQCPLFHQQQTLMKTTGMSEKCHFQTRRLSFNDLVGDGQEVRGDIQCK